MRKTYELDIKNRFSDKKLTDESPRLIHDTKKKHNVRWNLKSSFWYKLYCQLRVFETKKYRKEIKNSINESNYGKKVRRS